MALLIAGAITVGLFPQHWLRGVSIMAAGMLLAGALRALLPNGRAGLLAVRGRVFDATCYLGLGVLLVAFAVALPS